MGNIQSLISRVNSAFTSGQISKALELARQATREYPDEADAWMLSGRLNFHQTKHRVAREDFERAYALRPDDAQLVAEYSIVLDQLDAYRELRLLLDKAVERWPMNNELIMERSGVLERLGDFEAAKADHRQVLARDPHHVGAICAMVDSGSDSEIGGIKRVRDCLQSQQTGSLEQVQLSYALAQLLEQEERFDEAFDTYREANRLQAALGGMNVTAKQNGARAVIEDLTAQTFDSHSGKGHESARPVFIIGMPRSGSTLTEQVLAAHPDVFAAGERRWWLEVLNEAITRAPKQGNSMVEAVSGIHPDIWRQIGEAYLRKVEEIDTSSIRHIDKMLTNFTLIPYIRLVFPNARLIHVRREPLASLASCIRTNFTHPMYRLTVEDWSRFYGMYQALMDHWQPILGDQLL